MITTPVATARATQKVVIVDGTSEVLGLLENVLDAGHYDIVFVESSAHAYSQIKRVRPNLVILCVSVDNAEGFQVLSMLKLDADTRDIPVLTYTTEIGTEPPAEADAEPTDDTEMFSPKAAVRMN